MNKKILLIEDEVKLARFVELELKYEGYEVTVCHDGRAGFDEFQNGAYDLILLDLMLPGLNGIEICRRIRKTSDIPIIMLTAKDEVIDKVAGLDSGADDYVSKPFGMMELISRIKALIRRTADETKKDEYTVDGLYVCPSKHIVRANGNDVVLTYKEFELLCLLISNRGTVFNRDQILQRIWGFEFDGENRTVDVHIRTLRTKLGECGKLVETVRGIGYKIGG